MRYLSLFLFALLALMVFVATSLLAQQQRSIDNLLDEHRAYWPGTHNDSSECQDVAYVGGTKQHICWLSDSIYFLAANDVILSLQIAPENIRLGDGIVAFGRPDIHIDNRSYHFLKWTRPPVTLVARNVSGNWLMGWVDSVYLRQPSP